MTGPGESAASVANQLREPAAHQQENTLRHPATSGVARKPSTNFSKLIVHFRGILQGLAVRAVLLPSLEAQYKVIAAALTQK